MRKLLLVALVFGLSAMAFGQAKKPTLMVIPSDAWCIQNGYYLEFDDQGSITKVPDYKRAFQESTDLNNVISKINGIFADRGFPLQNMESVIKNIEADAAEDALVTSKSGGEFTESALDVIQSRAKSDIVIQLTWTVNENGPKKSVTFNMQGLDSYTNKQIATAQGTGAPSFSAELILLLEEAVLAHVDNFNTDLQRHFNDLFENGREVRVRVRVFDSWGEDLESEFGGDELTYVIDDWMAENTVSGRYTLARSTENIMVFEQVRIPLYDERERAMDTRRFARELSKYLKNNFGIVNKVMTKGLGEATIVLGDK